MGASELGFFVRHCDVKKVRFRTASLLNRIEGETAVGSVHRAGSRVVMRSKYAILVSGKLG